MLFFHSFICSSKAFSPWTRILKDPNTMNVFNEIHPTFLLGWRWIYFNQVSSSGVRVAVTNMSYYCEPITISFNSSVQFDALLLIRYCKTLGRARAQTLLLRLCPSLFNVPALNFIVEVNFFFGRLYFAYLACQKCFRINP